MLFLLLLTIVRGCISPKIHIFPLDEKKEGQEGADILKFNLSNFIVFMKGKEGVGEGDSQKKSQNWSTRVIELEQSYRTS